MDFCSEEFGSFVEETAKQANLDGWECTRGGSSDTVIWASEGIESVNLSAAYGNEHSPTEYLNIEACFNVTTLLKEVFKRSREMRRVLRENEKLFLS